MPVTAEDRAKCLTALQSCFEAFQEDHIEDVGLIQFKAKMNIMERRFTDLVRDASIEELCSCSKWSSSEEVIQKITEILVKCCMHPSWLEVLEEMKNFIEEGKFVFLEEVKEELAEIDEDLQFALCDGSEEDEVDSENEQDGLTGFVVEDSDEEEETAEPMDE